MGGSEVRPSSSSHEDWTGSREAMSHTTAAVWGWKPFALRSLKLIHRQRTLPQWWNPTM
jgi:hypothetical protein